MTHNVVESQELRNAIGGQGERVLSTLNADGTRNWIQPKLARGRFLRRRRIVGYALISLFVVVPFVKIGGRPALLVDLVTRELCVLGAVFRPSDGVVLMLLGITLVLAVVLLTALFGRVWCGWACPQTVYLEQVFRPIERWLEGSPAQRRKLDKTPGLHRVRVLKWAIYAVLAFVLANVFLAYFVGIARLEQWVLRSPADHLGGFTVVVAVAALVLFDFAYFREQACIVACPYGRLQSVLLDRQSLIVGYDSGRTDCVDCSACVAVCPTGIDIRQGLQMECIGCAQCIDACDHVMDKLKRPRGLIRYTSQDELAGAPKRLVRARTIAYPALLAISAGLLAWSIASRAATEVWVERVSGPSFVELPDGKISSQARIKLENDSDSPLDYVISLADAPDAQLRSAQPKWLVKPRKAMEIPLFVDVPRASFVRGERRVYLRIDDNTGYERIVQITLLGPDGDAK